VLYRTEGRIAFIELNRPERLNAIDSLMPGAINACVQRANADPNGMYGTTLQSVDA
jgi:enoyl-CoA hydratase